MSRVFGLVLKWHDNSELSPLGDASAKISWPNGISKLDRKFPSWSWRKSEESRARVAVDQEIEATSSLKDLINPKSITRKDFSDFEELDLMMTAELKWCYDIVCLIYEITERRAVTRQKGDKFLHWAEDWRMFSAEDNWVLFKKRRLKFSTQACHGRPRGQGGMKWRDAGNSLLEQAYSSVPKVKDTDWRKSLNSLTASPVTKAENSLSMVDKMKHIVVWLPTSYRVSWLQVWKQMHSWLSLPFSTSWW